MFDLFRDDMPFEFNFRACSYFLQCKGLGIEPDWVWFFETFDSY